MRVVKRLSMMVLVVWFAASLNFIPPRLTDRNPVVMTGADLHKDELRLGQRRPTRRLHRRCSALRGEIPRLNLPCLPDRRERGMVPIGCRPAYQC